MEEVNKVLEKYNNFADAQIKSIVTKEDESKVVVMSIQDDDGEEIGEVSLEFSGIKEARILQNHVLAFLDMMSGVTIIEENGLYGFGIGHGESMLHVHNAPLYIISESISIEEC